MNSFSIRYTVLLLFSLTWEFGDAYAENDSHHNMTPAKVFTNYLKVPWINLNTLWKDGVTSPCRDDITTLFESADAGEMWALQMLDAASKIPAGLFTGNIRDLGMYVECTSVKADLNPGNIQGRHCMVSMSMPPKFVGEASAALYIQKLSAYNPTPDALLNFAASVCLPSSCGVEDVAGFINASIQGTPELAQFEVGVAQVTCSSTESVSENFPMGTILAMSFFVVVAIYLAFCTACDFVVKARCGNAPMALKTLAKFSLYTNTIKLWSTEITPGTMPAINGIRFLSMCFVVTIHRLLSTMVKPLVNLSAAYELRQTWLAPFMLILPYSVDTFFIISGFLTTYLFLKQMQSGGKINILQLYLHRYIRLTPCIAVLLIIDIFILPHLGSGPIWEIVLGVTSDFCRKNWWTNLLYVQNFVNSDQMCMPHTWYSAVEMQLFWICPIILYPLYHRPKLGLFMLTMLLTTALITPAIHLVINQFSFLFNTNKIFQQEYLEFISSYTLTYNRALPYFVGIFLGYYVVNHKRELTKVQATFNWILSGMFILFCFWNTQFIQPKAIVYNAAWEAAYVSVGRLAWSLAISWILYACSQGYAGPVARFLSLPIFVPLSRMSYGIYLVSAVIQVGINASEKTAEFNSPLAMLYLVWGDLVTSIAAAFLISLCFESPIFVLEKILRAKKPSANIKQPLTGQTEKLAAIIKQYPVSTSDRLEPDLAIHARMSQPDFWRTVSEVLNTLGKKETKTPTEWLKTWQDWRSSLSSNSGQWKTCANNNRNGSAQLETGTTTLEKELLIFLAAVNCSLDDDTANVKELNTTNNKTAVSQLDSFVSQREDFIRLPTFHSIPLTETTR